MKGLFRALAIDYDGTLTLGGPPTAQVLGALSRARLGGMRLVLVTGRILAELRREFAAVDACFDAIVGENGAVLWMPERGPRSLAPALPAELGVALVARGVPITIGDVLLATFSTHDPVVLEEIARLGLECHIIHNRGALMVLPAGISKASGVREALAELGISHHSAIGVGDAENDHSLLDACEVGVAVGNALESLKRHADVVLDVPDGDGIEALLASPLLAGTARICPRRWQVTLGATATGPVRLAGSPSNVFITGGASSGKSHLAGLFAERLIELGYAVCVLDPEGDHLGLGQLREVVVLGGAEELPSPDQVTRLLSHGVASVVVDLSLADDGARRRHGRDLLRALAALRAETGLPHWIIIDEAHLFRTDHAGACVLCDPEQAGLCLVTYRPEGLCGDLRFDAVLVASSGAVSDREFLRASGLGVGDAVAAAFETAAAGEALLVQRARPEVVEVFRPAARRSHHVRHWHKYAEGQVAPHLRFVFRNGHGPTGGHAGNLVEFHRELEACPAAVIEHHRKGHDFARWIRDVLRDTTLAGTVRALGESEATDETVRHAILLAVEHRYLATGGPSA